ncbi:MAG: hypothetical protein JWQ91_109 [Aeromicrobium sp.]|jgi:hypothetical protein|uniref:SHOCT domain-containing protein n=1 Tax=Aeromicrobium sp. TaxID=1871063 RepID=UPI002632E268|nr:SHOCT domain-containing protein [Aeromicrobium sp.]MCW2790084.1 hypothetical protein [Aeromicrobium sp.]MCW2823192.1 hypothetical protein [Aeromicrobium sp.]
MEDFSFWDLFVSIFWFTLLLAWITLLIHILGDLFRDNELSGGVKALWTLFIVLLPWLGTLCYLIVRGGSMNERYRQASQERDADMRAYVQDAAGGSNVSSQLKELAEMRDRGTISPTEYEQAKTKVLT